MSSVVGFYVRRRWWRRFHQLVRIGWLVTKNNKGGSTTQAYLGFGLMGVGLMLKRRRRQVLYSETMRSGQEFRIKVTQGDRSIFLDQVN